MTDRIYLYLRQTAATLTLASAALFSVVNPVMAESSTPLALSSTTATVQDALFVQTVAGQTGEPAQSVQEPRQEPWKVALTTAVLPGYGQIYNDAAWKLPIYYGLLGYFTYRAIDNSNKYSDYRDRYNDNPDGPDASDYADKRDNYRDKRNSQMLWAILTHVAGIADAYIDAQLYDFDRITDEGLNTTAIDADIPAIGYTMKF